jgi:hypothetical protein
MESSNATERVQPSGPDSGEAEAVEFVRFCYRRRRVGWPELYDEMCAVAGRGIYRGYGSEDLSRIGIGFALYELPALASIVQRVVAEDLERRRLSAHALRLAPQATDARQAPIATSSEPEPAEMTPRLLAVAAGA